MPARDQRNAPTICRRISSDQERAASALLELAITGKLSLQALRDLGAAVVRYDLGSPAWHLKGWKKPRRLPPMTGVVAMCCALQAANRPQRVRFGQEWVKRDDGRPDPSCLPARLPPAQFARWLRRRCLKEVEAAVAESRRQRAPDGPGALDSSMDRVVHPWANNAWFQGGAFSPGEPTLDQLMTVLSPREQRVLQLHLKQLTQPRLPHRWAAPTVLSSACWSASRRRRWDSTSSGRSSRRCPAASGS